MFGGALNVLGVWRRNGRDFLNVVYHEGIDCVMLDFGMISEICDVGRRYVVVVVVVRYWLRMEEDERGDGQRS